MLKARKKITRKELKHDPLMDTIYKFRQFWGIHQTNISRYGGIILVALVLSVLVIRWRSTQDEKARAVTGIAFIEFGSGNYNTVISQLVPVVDEYSGLKSFGSGLFLLARSELFVGDTVNAELHFQLFLDEYGQIPLLKCGAYGGLGIIAESRKEYIAAARLFESATLTAREKSSQVRYAILAGRNFLLADAPEETIKLLNPFLEIENLDFQAASKIKALITAAELKAQRG